MMRCNVVSALLGSSEGWSAAESLTHEPLEFSQGNPARVAGKESRLPWRSKTKQSMNNKCKCGVRCRVR
jgi:hypothetical protein